MTGEMWALVVAVGLGIVHVSADSFSYKAQEGNAYTVGPRDEERPRRAVAGRLHRAARNYTENLVLLLAVVLVLHAQAAWGPWSHYGLWIWVVARFAYLLAYAWGVPWVRTACWQVSMVGLLVAGAQLWL